MSVTAKILNPVMDITASLWISASAGTGKTKSLIDRLLALLLNGVAPHKILCLTYTRAAAAEMLGRLGKYLYDLHHMPDNRLKNELENMGFSEIFFPIAKSLHEKSLNSSEWVQIKTIHSFCLDIIEKFPIETGLLPGVKLCDDHQRQQMLSEVRATVLRDKKNHPLLELLSDYTNNVFGVIEQNIASITKQNWKMGNFPKLYADFFEVPPEDLTLNFRELDISLLNKIFSDQYAKIFGELAEILSTGKSTDIAKAENFKKSAKNSTTDFLDAIFTQELTVRDKLCTQDIAKRHPDFPHRLQKIVQQAQEFLEEKKKRVSAKVNAIFFSIAEQVIDGFKSRKQQNHYIDFDDVIAITANLLHNMEWVLYKTDGGVDHVLIDEAQDTSPAQWEIIKIITDEFFRNYGSSKTVFVVGDEKQSIYSFQGADFKLFQQMHEYFKKRSESNGQKFFDVVLKKSYRSTGNILSFVDDVFCAHFPNVEHESARSADDGLVEVIDLFENDQLEEEKTWKIIKSSDQPMTADKKLSMHVARLINDAIAKGVWVPSRGRSAKAADFLILFRRRDRKIMKSLSDALKEFNIPVTGIDKVLLKEELIVEDLVTLAEFAIFPWDDLACARVMKSPIVGMTEEDLQEACIRRGNAHLWDYLLKNDIFCDKYLLPQLQKHLDNAFRLSVGDFFMTALTDTLRERFIARLGSKCLEVLYEFLNVVAEYESKNTASLQSFLEWFMCFEKEIKRESFGNENAVKLMTAHSSKGLQAPFVLLADCHFSKTKSDGILKTNDGLLLWDFPKDMDGKILRAKRVEQLRQEQSLLDVDESKRLLYVALTRAEDFLYILGQKDAGNKKLSDACWYSIVTASVDKKFTSRARHDHGLRVFGEYVFAPTAYADPAPPSNVISIPFWFFEKLKEPSVIPTKIEEKSIEIIYGDCVHLLLSEAHKYSPVVFETFSDHLLSKFELANDLKNNAKAEVQRLLAMSEYDFIFNKSSLTEVPFFHDGQEGRIDKIAFPEPNEIWIIDFKTGSLKKEIPTNYRKQLLFYKNAVGTMYPNKNIKTAILWTSTAKLAIVPDE
ncbi:MAG: UvrD-helicase domain-containing protein [Holosporaceae bacterium]|jgi:ATP-dependent helicase/nuclease subunit A|nr:UvrD-helicase domain-containing protein [Holosporaceae bacterium]